MMLETKETVFKHLIPVGVAVGAAFAGGAMSYSRKYVFLGLNIFGLIACLLSVLENM